MIVESAVGTAIIWLVFELIVRDFWIIPIFFGVNPIKMRKMEQIIEKDIRDKRKSMEDDLLSDTGSQDDITIPVRETEANSWKINDSVASSSLAKKLEFKRTDTMSMTD